MKLKIQQIAEAVKDTAKEVIIITDKETIDSVFKELEETEGTVYGKLNNESKLPCRSAMTSGVELHFIDREDIEEIKAKESEVAENKNLSYPTIDLEKFGFKKVSEHKHSKPFGQDGVYERELRENQIARLSVFASSYTLEIIFKDNDTKLTLADRYEISTQEQFDFLILNGRIRPYFAEKQE